MVLARWQATIVDDAGNVQDAASVEVRHETGGAPLATIYSDRDGTTPISNPLTTGSDGFAAFHVAGGAYKITATKGAFSRQWRYVGIGTAAENDLATILAGDFSSATVLPSGASTARTLAARFSDVINVKDYGAVGDGAFASPPTNDTAAVAAALTALGNDSGAIYFPAGTYLLDSDTLSKTLAAGQSIKIVGDGADATTLYFPDTGDGLTINFDAGNSFAWLDGSGLLVEDLAFVTDQANSAGAAFSINGAATIGNPTRPTIVNRVGFRGTGNNDSYWGNGIFATDLQNLEINDSYYFANVLGLSGTAISFAGSSDAAHPTVLNVHNFQMQFGEVGVHCTGYVEGLNVTQSNFTQVSYGILVDTDAAIPMFSAYGSQFNAKTVGIQIEDGTACQIVGNLIFVDDPDSPPSGGTGIVTNTKYSTICGNTMVALDAGASNGIILQSGATDNIIAGNVFKGFVTDIWFQSGANNNRAGPNRHVDGTPVVDQGTGNLWFDDASAVVTAAATQTLTNKTINGGNVAPAQLATPIAAELTIASGVITVTSSFHPVDTESNAATDDLVTINGGTDGMRVVLTAADNNRTIVVKDSTGNIQCAGDHSLDTVADTIELMYHAGISQWIELCRSNNA